MFVTLLVLGLTALVVVIFSVLYVLYRRLWLRNFGQKAVLITGADKGIGRSVVQELDRRGLTVFAACHSQNTAQQLAREVSERVKTLVIEVTDRQSVVEARNFVEANLPPHGLWGLVNNAGVARGIIFDFAQVDDYKDVMDVNFFGTVQVTEVFLPLIKKSGGRIVNMISIMGRFSGAAGPYSCSKFALEAYTDGLRRCMLNFGVGVSAIEPGFYKTKMTDRQSSEHEIHRLWDSLPQHVKNEYGEESKNRALEKFGEFMENPLLSQCNQLEDVAKDVVHALGAVHPKAHYVCGTDANFIYRWAALLPDFLVDYIFPMIGPINIYVAPTATDTHPQTQDYS